MSHFSVLVAIPAADKCDTASSVVYSELPGILEPYCESTENPAYLQFVDKEEECRDEYSTGTCRAVHFPDGHIDYVYSAEVSKLFSLNEETLTVAKHHDSERSETELVELLANCTYLPDCPFSQVYPTFDDYMENWHGMSNKNLQHRYGYFSNPQAEWDWYQIGGRWPGAFLVKDSTTDFVASEDSGEDEVIPEFRPCSGARKEDICWDKMKELAQEELREKYRLLTEIQVGTRKPENMMRIENGSLYGWSNDALLLAGESESEYLKRNRAGEAERGIPAFYAFVDADGQWHSQGDMGWWGISSNDKPQSDWNEECRQFVEACADSTVLVMVDCHI